MKKNKPSKGEELFDIWRETEELYSDRLGIRDKSISDVYIAMEAVGKLLNKYLK